MSEILDLNEKLLDKKYYNEIRKLDDHVAEMIVKLGPVFTIGLLADRMGEILRVSPDQDILLEKASEIVSKRVNYEG